MYYSATFKTNASIRSGEYTDTSDYTNTGEVSLYCGNRKIGYLKYTIFQYGSVVDEDATIHLLDLLDDHSADTAEYLPLFTRKGKLKESVARVLGDPCMWVSRILSLDRLYIQKRFRGRGLAEKLIRATVEQYASDDTLTLFCVSPLIDAKHEFDPASDGREKLVKHYRKMGFKLLKRGNQNEMPVMGHHHEMEL